MTQVNYSVKDFDIFIGIDVDKKSFALSAKDHNVMNQLKKIPSDPENFYNYIQNAFVNKKVLCAYEAGPTGFHLYDYLKEKDVPCLVVSPSSVPKAPNERVKTNRIDSEKLAQFLKAGELTSIRVPEGIYRELRYLAKSREEYAHNRVIIKQRIKALLLIANLYPLLRNPAADWSQAYIEQLQQIECPEGVRTRLNMLLIDLEGAKKQTLSIHSSLRTFCRNNKEINHYVKYLRSIPGIGFILSVTILSKIGDPSNLKNLRELAAFVGLVPTERSTGDDINKGSITHLGNQLLRSLLIESSWIAIRKDNELNQFYHRIKNRHHHKIGAKKAIVAVARKLTQRIYKVLKEQRMYVIH